MGPFHTTQRHTSARRQTLIYVGIRLLAWPRLLPVGTQAQAPTTAAARDLAQAFRSVARQATPAVVFITVEKTIANRSPFGFNNPFDAFGDEFLERFFGRRSPQ